MQPLFPGEGARHRQRAFRDALTDILAPDYGFAPTLRIAHFEVKDWINPARRSVKGVEKHHLFPKDYLKSVESLIGQ